MVADIQKIPCNSPVLADILRLSKFNEFKILSQGTLQDVKALVGDMLNARRTTGIPMPGDPQKEVHDEQAENFVSTLREASPSLSSGGLQMQGGEESPRSTRCTNSSSGTEGRPKLPPIVMELCSVVDALWVPEVNDMPMPRRLQRPTTHPAGLGSQHLAPPSSVGGRSPELVVTAPCVYTRADMLRSRDFELRTAMCFGEGVSSGGSRHGAWRAALLAPTQALAAPPMQVPPKPRAVKNTAALVVPPEKQLSCITEGPSQTPCTSNAAGCDTASIVHGESPIVFESDIEDMTDCESVCSEASEDTEPTVVLVAPTNMAVAPMTLDQLWLPTTISEADGTKKKANIRLQSNPRQLAISDVMRLAEARSLQAPLSFGSVLHMCHGDGAPCRPCMFERWDGRCSRKWLCDFCHLHVGQKQRRKDAGQKESRTVTAAPKQGRAEAGARTASCRR